MQKTSATNLYTNTDKHEKRCAGTRKTELSCRSGAFSHKIDVSVPGCKKCSQGIKHDSKKTSEIHQQRVRNHGTKKCHEKKERKYRKREPDVVPQIEQNRLNMHTRTKVKTIETINPRTRQLSRGVTTPKLN